MKQVLNQCSANGDKGIVVIKPKRGKLVTLAANGQNFPQGELAGHGFFPEFLCRGITRGGGLVQGLLLTAQSLVDDNHSLPWPIFQPRLFYLDLEDFRRRLDLIRCKVATPSLLRWPFPVRAKSGSATKRS